MVTVLLVMVAGAIVPQAQTARALEQLLGSPISVGSDPLSVAVNPTTNRIYVTNNAANSVSVIDGTTNARIDPAIAVGTNPSGIAVNPVTNRVYVANLSSNTVTVIDANNNTIVGTPIAVGLQPQGVAVNPTTNRIYVANQGNFTVSVIDGASGGNSGAGAIIGTAIAVGSTPVGVAVSPTTNRIFVTNLGSDTVSVINGAGGGNGGAGSIVGGPIAVGDEPIGVAVDPVTNLVYVANRNSGSVTVISGNSGSIIGTPIAVGNSPTGVAVNPITRRVYVTNSGDDTVSVIDGASSDNGTAGGVVGAAISMGSGAVPRFLAVNPTTSFVYIANQGPDTVSVLGVPFLAETVITSVTNASDVGAIAVNPVTNRVYQVRDKNSVGKLLVLDGTTLQPVAGSPIDVGDHPYDVAVNPTTNRIYVTNTNGESVSVIDGATNTLLGTISMGAGNLPYGVTVNPTTNTIYVALFRSVGDQSVGVIAGGVGAFGTLSTPINFGSQTSAELAYNATNNRIYAPVYGSNSVLVIDASSNSLVGPAIAIGTNPSGIAVNPTTNRVYVANYGSNTVTVINGATDTVEGSEIRVGLLPQAVAVNSTTNRAYIANTSATNVSMLDGATRAVLGNPLDEDFALTYDVAVNEKTNRLYVATSPGPNLHLIGPNYSASATQTLAGASVQVTFGSLFGASGADKIGLFPAGTASNASPISSVFTNGTGSGTGVTQGTVSLAIPGGQAAGNYEIRFVSGHTTQTLASLAFRVVSTPVANPDSYSVNNGSTLTVPGATGVLLNDTDADTVALLLQAQIVNRPPNGSLVLSPTGGFTYTPLPGFSGVDTFTYRAVDSDGLASTATVSITVNPVTCGPRPGVTVTNTVNGGALESTITASGANAPGNALTQLRFGTFTNAVVTLNGQTVTLPSATTSVTLTVRRATAGQVTTVPLTAVDSCGEWPTFVGGGAGAGF